MSTQWILTGTGFLAITLSPSLVLIAVRKRLGVLNAASWLVIWGVLAASGEHAFWAMESAPGEPLASSHARVHYFMAGVYTAIGGVLLCLIARTMLREGRRTGWYAVLFTLLVGGSLEVVMNGPAGLLFQHGFSTSESRPEGMGLFGYLFAWSAALMVAYKPIFTRTHNAKVDSGGHPAPEAS